MPASWATENKGLRQTLPAVAPMNHTPGFTPRGCSPWPQTAASSTGACTGGLWKPVCPPCREEARLELVAEELPRGETLAMSLLGRAEGRAGWAQPHCTEETSHLTEYWEINHCVGSHQSGDGLDTVIPWARPRADTIISHFQALCWDYLRITSFTSYNHVKWIPLLTHFIVVTEAQKG